MCFFWEREITSQQGRGWWGRGGGWGPALPPPPPPRPLPPSGCFHLSSSLRLFEDVSPHREHPEPPRRGTRRTSKIYWSWLWEAASLRPRRPPSSRATQRSVVKSTPPSERASGSHSFHLISFRSVPFFLLGASLTDAELGNNPVILFIKNNLSLGQAGGNFQQTDIQPCPPNSPLATFLLRLPPKASGFQGARNKIIGTEI